jgi:hypothetical protein
VLFISLLELTALSQCMGPTGIQMLDDQLVRMAMANFKQIRVRFWNSLESQSSMIGNLV